MAARPAAGERRAGDAGMVEFFSGGAFVAVVDALGHGEQAASTAASAVAALQGRGGSAPGQAMAACHAGIRGTRGAAVSLAVFDWTRRQLDWLGIGNVLGVLRRASGGGATPALISLLVRAGVVGDRLASLRAVSLEIGAGDTLAIATDGVRPDFCELLQQDRDPQEMAEYIVAHCARPEDDALALVFRCPARI
jgi:negative regulator of sigma-B (phosphoserine phosphatase)